MTVEKHHLKTLREADNSAAPVARLIRIVESGDIGAEDAATGRQDAPAD
jgi:hypothetical protein